jgi:site-specific DNA-methyltransferase (adenine-specific)
MPPKKRLNRILLFNEDCLNGIRKHLKAASVDIVVTSPPYNIGVNYKTYKDNIPRQEYLKWLNRWAGIVNEVLKDSGSLFLNIGSKPSSPDGPFQVLETIRRHFKLQNVIHWIKSIYIENESYGEETNINVGHYKPINSPRFLNDTHEYIFHLTKTGHISLDRLAIGVPYKDQTNVDRWNSGRNKLRCRGNCWYIPYPTIQRRKSDRPHPASFPPRLAENCIKLHGLKRNLVVLDPFMGIGNTGLACRNLEVNFIGFETDSGYLRVAEEALESSRNAETPDK